MSSDEEYYIILHVGRHFVKDPYVRFVDGELCQSFGSSLRRLTYMLNMRLITHPISVDEMFLLTAGEGDVEGVQVDGEGDDGGVECDGEGNLERVEFVGEGAVGGVQADREGVSAIGIKVDEYGGVKSGGHISLGFTIGEDNDSEVVVDEYAVVEKRRMGMRLRYETQMNMDALLGSMKMKNMKMVRE
ncbi:hypothetical protein Goshw_014277 [Gossypium schwendimanii]|uniref:Uncharacterized protein n=1 Tax=Gossypium schwendimanii TaxID=34291 RepID=A0A7J9MHX3_GOSSC|nr:hypothetical protein [Gossypium schwendimanii]